LAAHGFAASVEDAPGPRVQSLVSAGQGRLDAHFALAALRQQRPGRVLGLAGVDLKEDTRPLVYGLAEVNGRVAVFSAKPFFDRGLGPQESLDRLAGAVLHELAHTFGMVHCRSRGCLMNATHEPAVLRRLDPRFCASCQRSWRLRIDRAR
jgi:predicted Zn-dependent protease